MHFPKNWSLNFFETGEWQVCHERLRELRSHRVVVNPNLHNLFLALEKLSPDQVKVAILGQDPYPNHEHATGIAFHTGVGGPVSPTLRMMFDEFESDLHFPRPKQGNLEPWINEGVLLWNVIPSCSEGHSLSHDWDEWYYLNKEIIEKLNDKGIVFVLLGSKAKTYASLIDKEKNVVIETSHPSPRGNQFSKTPFLGSKFFSRTNDALVTLGKKPVDWRL